MVVPRRFRLRFCDFLVRMWLWNALPRLTRPLAVTLKRLAEPRWLFILGIATSPFVRRRGDGGLAGRLLPFGRLGRGGQHHHHAAPFEHGMRLHLGDLLQLV